MVNEYHDGIGEHINSKRYDELIEEWANGQTNLAPYIIDPRNPNRRRVGVVVRHIPRNRRRINNNNANINDGADTEMELEDDANIQLGGTDIYDDVNEDANATDGMELGGADIYDVNEDTNATDGIEANEPTDDERIARSNKTTSKTGGVQVRYIHPRIPLVSSARARHAKIKTKHQQKIMKQNRLNLFASLHARIVKQNSIQDLEKELKSTPPVMIEPGYPEEWWQFTRHEPRESGHLFHFNRSTDKVEHTRRWKEIRERYDKETPNHPDRKYYIDRVRYWLHRLSCLPFYRFNHFDLDEAKKISRDNFNKRMSQYDGSQFEDCVGYISKLLPTKQSYYAVDKNGKLLFVFFNNFINDDEVKKMELAALELLLTFPNQKAKAKDPRHKGEAGVSVYHLMDWCPRGHRNNKCVSRQALANGRSLSIDSIIRLTASMNNTRINTAALLECIDPVQHAEYLDVVQNHSTLGYQALLKACNQDIFLGCVLNTGRCRNHRDWSDVFGGLSAMMPLGHFAGANMVLPQLGVRLPYKPGSLLFSPTQALEHFITPWRGFRVGVVHCSHDDRVRPKTPKVCTNIKVKPKRATKKTASKKFIVKKHIVEKKVRQVKRKRYEDDPTYAPPQKSNKLE